ncbi:hypothetical protein JMK98_03315 [Pediococcus pentosaceus]|uniref:hypothetical protein n=1 Tax=Pediococcus pentosaceus TaxID=1255 RepID=UPI0019632A75|nr:hypothetical protein [Pediococcus pentosaceus]MBM9929513.1 hypothetical protein [Pediococcus pentosaceus]
MWYDLPRNEKDDYKSLITNFASLSEAFAQKAVDSNDIVAPIVNSKFQETVFQKCFHAYAEDISNTSYDASINTKSKKYLIGIKTFGINSGDQKVAQFKAISSTNEWSNLLNQIQNNAGNLKKKEEINKVNCELYLELAKKIAKARNERIESSKKNLRGFKVDDTDTLAEVEAVYHVLMPSSKNETASISVGETSYPTIDISNLKICGCTTAKNPKNFLFTDGKHKYKYNAADSQLLMDFDNKNIVCENWKVSYVDDAFDFFQNMGSNLAEKSLESHSWLLEVQPYSGFNAFYGQSKLGSKNNEREKRIQNIINNYGSVLISENQYERVVKLLKELLLTKWSTKDAKELMVSKRDELMQVLQSIDDNEKLIKDIRTAVYRPTNELELRIPDAYKFHQKYPYFFTEHSIFKPGTKKCVKDKKLRSFKLKFVPSGKIIDAYINQDNGKAIESLGSQKILGEWILRDIFQLPPYEPLTEEKMLELGINGTRLTKNKDAIELAFIWIDSKNPPEDFWKKEKN